MEDRIITKADSLDSIIDALSDRNEITRIDAAIVLGELADRRAVAALVTALGDRKWRVRRSAAEALGSIGDMQAVAPLLTALKDKDIAVSATAREALVRICGAKAPELLYAALQDRDWRMRSRVVEALGEIGDIEAKGPVAAMLNDKHKEVRFSANKALKRLSDTRTVEQLVAALREKEWSVRTEAARKLDQLKWIPERAEDKAYYYLEKYKFKECAKAGAPAVAPLIEALNRSSAGSYREMILATLGEIGDARAIDTLIGFLESGPEALRIKAAEALGNIGDARSVQPLTAALNNASKPLQNMITAALQKIHNPAAAGRLKAENRGTAQTQHKEAHTPQSAADSAGGYVWYEKDNLGTRQDTFDKAAAYWTARRRLVKKSPFVLFVFKNEKEAREALLELPCIHVAADSNQLICTDVLYFGYYPILDSFEAILCGEDLTYELWEQARNSFIRHGGTLKNEEAPDKMDTAQSRTPVQLDSVKFVKEQHVQDQYGDTVYRVYEAPDADTAKEFLSRNPVDRPLFFIVVETPDGSYGRDINGIYKEEA